MDPHRVNEYGTSASDQQPPAVGGADQPAAIISATAENEPIVSDSDGSELSLDGDNNELRRRLHKRED